MEKKKIREVRTEIKRKRFRGIFTDGAKEGHGKRRREAGMTLRG